MTLTRSLPTQHPRLRPLPAEPADSVPWPRLARTHIREAAAHDGPLRLVVTGAAGSGKSSVLRHLRRRMAAQGEQVADGLGPIDLESATVFVDDAHNLDREALERLAARLSDDRAGIVLACRPWPQPEGLRDLIRAVERTRPAVVLGRLGAADVNAWLDREDRDLASSRVDRILQVCGNVSWLVAEALVVEDELAAGNDDACIAAIADALLPVVVHRVQGLAPAVRDAVELACAAGESGGGGLAGHIVADVAAAAVAEGLMTGTGTIPPVVRAAVRATLSTDRVTALLARASADADPVVRARAAWDAGRLDDAARALDAAPKAAGDADAADLAAAIWTARGLAETGNAIYAASGEGTAIAFSHSLTVAVAVGDADRTSALEAPRPTGMPSTAEVSCLLLASGLRASLASPPDGALAELIRATEMYTASRSADPAPEVPAVIAAVTAIHLGEADVAARILAGALGNGHGGDWARCRLLLWTAWVAMQRERPQEATAARVLIEPHATALPTRDRLVWHALQVGLARRYGDTAEHEAAWAAARDILLRARFDLFTLLPLGEFAMTAARLDDDTRIASHLRDALTLVERLGSPPLWSPWLHWVGVQRGILSNDPQSLPPHARALLAAAPHSRPAATMARAGRVWTSVLSGAVDADAVEAAALGLSEIGLAWDGARLAAHGAAHTDDRRAISRLLSCARLLHPRADAPACTGDDPGEHAAVGAAGLSPRETEVAHLVLQGKTYAEIGAAIFVSPRTVEHHVARIRQRLGAVSRSDLMTKLRAALAEHTEPGSGRPLGPLPPPAHSLTAGGSP